MKTEALYYEAPALGECEATVLGIRDGALILDRTLFYPEGGGQPCDSGSLAGISLASVTESEGVVLHRLQGGQPAGIEAGARVRLVLDEARRRDHREQHSGQHLLSSTLLRLFGAATKSFHLGEERCTIDVAGPFVDEASAAEAEAFANAVIADAYPVVTHLCPPEDLASFPLRRVPPAGEEVIRVIEIDGMDFTPCCGTHVRNTSEIRLLLVLGVGKYKGMTRVEFVAGGRALDWARRSVAGAREAGRVLGCLPEGLGAEAGRLSARLKAREAELRAMVRERSRAEAAAWLASGKPAPAVLRFTDRNADAALEACKALAEAGVVAVAASVPDLVACAVAPGPGAELGRRLAPAADAAGGKGGGGPASFRASFRKTSELDEFLALAPEKLQN